MEGYLRAAAVARAAGIETPTGTAVWRSDTGDVQVEIAGYCEERNGSHFLSAERIDAGVPLDEIVLEGQPSPDLDAIFGMSPAERIRSFLGVSTEPLADRTTTAPSEAPDAVEQARSYLTKVDPAISGQRGHDATYRAARLLVHGFALDGEQALQLLMEEFNPRCRPAWAEKDLRHKVDDALRASDPQGRPRGHLLGRAPKVVYAEALAAAQELTSDSKPEEVDGVVRAMVGFDPLRQDHVLRLVKKKTGITLGTLRKQARIVQPQRDSEVNAATRIVGLAKEEGVELFHNPDREPFAVVPRGDHREVWPVRSEDFKLLLRRLFFVAENSAANADALSAARGILEAEAIFEGPSRDLHLRVAVHEHAVWIDLCDKEWRAVRVCAEGWLIIDDPPPLFRRYGHMAAHTEPSRDGDLRALLDFVNVREEDDRLLLLVWVVAAFIPDISHAILIVHGPKGAAKTSTCRLLRRVIDPSSLLTLSLHRDTQEVVQQLAHHFLPCYDNLDGLSGEMSDLLCRAATGEGFTKRRLYTDEDDIVFRYRRVLVLNGINAAARKSDLLDRSVLLPLAEIPEERRREERKIDQAFADALPKILGGVLDLLVGAIGLYGSVRLDRLPRMADFARWGEAIARAMGEPEGRFMEAYMRRLRSQAREAVRAHPVGAAVVAFMADKDNWTGSPALLLSELNHVADKTCIDKRSRQWPGAPHWLVRRLQEVIVDLRHQGIHIEVSRTVQNHSCVTLQRASGVNGDRIGEGNLGGRGRSGGTTTSDYYEERTL